MASSDSTLPPVPGDLEPGIAARGVGHCSTSRRRFRPNVDVLGVSPFAESKVVGVAQDEHTLSLMGCPDI